MSPHLICLGWHFNFHIISRPDPEAGHNRDLGCQLRHIKWGLILKPSIRAFSWQQWEQQKKIVTFLFNFGIHWLFLPKFHILVAKICIDLRLFSKFPKWPKLMYIWPKFIKIKQNSLIYKRQKRSLLALPGLDTWYTLSGIQNSNLFWMPWEGGPSIKAREGQRAPFLGVRS